MLFQLSKIRRLFRPRINVRSTNCVIVRYEEVGELKLMTSPSFSGIPSSSTMLFSTRILYLLPPRIQLAFISNIPNAQYRVVGFATQPRHYPDAVESLLVYQETLSISIFSDNGQVRLKSLPYPSLILSTRLRFEAW